MALAKENLDNAHAQCNVLESYMDMLMQINTDLVEGVQAKHEAKEQINQFVVVPHFAWPRGIVRKATKIVTEAAASDIHEAKLRARQDVKASKRSSGGSGVASMTKRKKPTAVAKGEKEKKTIGENEVLFKRKSPVIAPTRVPAVLAAAKNQTRQGSVKTKGYLRPKTY